MNSPKKTGTSREASPTPAERFGALADPARLTILSELHHGANCVCDLSPRLGMAPNLLSYHLGVLREAGLVEGTRRGRRVEYHVRPEGMEELTVKLVRLAVGADRR